MKSLNFSIVLPKMRPFFTSFHPLQDLQKLDKSPIFQFPQTFWEVFCIFQLFYCYKSVQSHPFCQFSIIFTGFFSNFDWIWILIKYFNLNQVKIKNNHHPWSKLYNQLTWKSKQTAEFTKNETLLWDFHLKWVLEFSIFILILLILKTSYIGKVKWGVQSKIIRLAKFAVSPFLDFLGAFLV